MQHRGGGLLDILPFSEGVAPGGKLELEKGVVLNMAGFRYVMPSAVTVSIADDLKMPVTPIPLYVLLKLVAFSDRRSPKDLVSVMHCLEHYLENNDRRRYGLDHALESVPFEYTCAYLVGLDCLQYQDSQVTDAVRSVLDRFSDADAAVVGMVALEQGRAFVEPEHKNQIFQLFRWFRLGARL